MGVTEEAGKAVSGTIDALKSTPTAIALLVLNVVFLLFAVYLLGEVASNSAERNKTQTDLIAKLIAECRQVQKP